MAKKRTLDELLTDSGMGERFKERLYSKQGLPGKESSFSELLQGMVDAILNAEIDTFLEEERACGKPNKRNSHTRKKVVSEVGLLEVSTPRDRNGDFEPEVTGKREEGLSAAWMSRFWLYMPKAIRLKMCVVW